MSVDWAAEIVAQVVDHWHGQLRPRLEGLTDEEYLWEPVPDCWTVRPRAAGELAIDHGEPGHGPDPVTTIAWRLGHLTYGFAETVGTHFGGAPVSLETFPYAGTAAGALQQLDAACAAWIEGVRSLGAEGLARPQGPSVPVEFADAPMARLVLYTSTEVIHHGAEVCLLRDLFLRRDQL